MIGPVQQLIAPNGYATLMANIVYFVLRSARLSRVFLVSFFTIKSRNSKQFGETPKYRIDYLSRDSYEEGLVTGKIRLLRDEESMKLPPWLAHKAGADFTADEYVEPKDPDDPESLSQKDRVDQRVVYLAPAMMRLNEILGSDFPEKVLNGIARSFPKPIQQNDGRYRLWFFVLLAFGGNAWALMPAYSGGKWNRCSVGRAKTGRKSIHGASYGFRMSAKMRKDIADSFLEHARKGDFFAEVYVRSMRQTFNCVITRTQDGRPIAKSRTGRAVPSYDQFRYYVYKGLGKAEVDRRLLGDQGARHDKDAPQGSFSESVTDAYETVHWDVQFTEEHPRGYIKDHGLPPMPIADIVDGACGICLGVGGSLGGEAAETYRMALFCMAIRKSKFGEIIGYPIRDDEWPCYGRLALEYISDRGKATARAVRLPLTEFLAALEAVPSYTPQSNATAEATHERHRKTTGCPQHRVSDLNPIQMLYRRVQAAMTRMRSASALERATPEMIDAGVKTPLDMYRYMEARGRITGIPIDFDDAVRKFLNPVEFRVKQGHLVLEGLVKFRSRQLVNNLDWKTKVRNWENGRVKGYVVGLAPGTAWVEIGESKKLIEVKAVGTLNGVKQALRMPLIELYGLGAKKRQLVGQVRHDRRLEQVEARNKFKAGTGKEWDGGRTVRGTYKKTQAVNHEIRALKVTPWQPNAPRG